MFEKIKKEILECTVLIIIIFIGASQCYWTNDFLVWEAKMKNWKPNIEFKIHDGFSKAIVK